MIDFLDGESDPQLPTSVNFRIERTDDDDITCEEARAFGFSPYPSP
jgi:hypothetical protein